MSTDGVLLAIDLGTEGARVGAFTVDGEPLGSVHRGYRTTYPRPGWAEQDPEEWWSAVVDATRTLLAEPRSAAAGPVVALACATTASTVAVLDADGRPLRPAILWMDSRAWAQSAATTALLDEHPVLAWSGGSDAAEWLLPKAVWVAEHEPDVFARAGRVVEAIDYLTFRLTGRWVGSQMNAVCKYNYDPLARRFPVELYAALGVEGLVDLLPDEIVEVGGPAGPLTAQAADALGIAAGAAVAVGGIDAHVSLLSCGGASAGLVSVVSGTSSAIVAELELGPGTQPALTPEVWGPYPHALRTDRWLVEGGQVSSGSVLTWAAESIMGVTRAELPALVRGAAAVEPGAHGLRALDTFMGNRTPHRDPRLRGAVVGLTLGTTREELYRASVEAVACGTRAVVDSFVRAGVMCDRLVLSGGIEHNPLWQQVTVDVLGREAEIVSGDNLTLRACAVIAATGAGLVANLDDGASRFAPRTRTLTPDAGRHAVYRETYDDYVSLLHTLAPVMHDSVDRLGRA
ncbi:FGGY-family carbohydrate kinase [Microlunatus flavus]|uniref:Ribulose kinase n=1 Tax=Microlunatus flavus TaxID=1036181 RepID=A0A1H9FAP9_9ACTN|nr:FGGY family carbohydrate kinase [Microlunatus flavus]SEQ35006.1 Ribulose kinase [Microlunatus flavus]